MDSVFGECSRASGAVHFIASGRVQVIRDPSQQHGMHYKVKEITIQWYNEDRGGSTVQLYCVLHCSVLKSCKLAITHF